jgi:hypothetical protein
MQTRGYLLVAIAVLTLESGCGGPAMAPVRGRLLCKGKPVADAAIIVSPMAANPGDRESGKAASAGTDAEGRFVLSTFKQGDGAIVGKHRFAISLDENARLPCKSKVMIV